MANKYEKQRVLGHGTFGRVWLVKGRQDHQLYCMKEMDVAAPGADTEARTEAQMHAGLRHPHIISYEEVSRRGNYVYLVMEYAAQGDLASLLARRARLRHPLTEESTLVWTNHILQGLAYMHRRGMVHRDVKSANIFIMANGVVKLGDMGCSKVLEQNATRIEQRTCSTPCGTPMYQAPEQCDGTPYTQKVDIWALGCVVYEMCALRPTFDARNIHELGRKIRAAAFRRKLPSIYSQDVRSLIDAMLTVDVYRRPAARDLILRPCIAKYDECRIDDRGRAIPISSESGLRLSFEVAATSPLRPDPVRYGRRSAESDDGVATHHSTQQQQQREEAQHQEAQHQETHRPQRQQPKPGSENGAVIGSMVGSSAEAKRDSSLASSSAHFSPILTHHNDNSSNGSNSTAATRSTTYSTNHSTNHSSSSSSSSSKSGDKQGEVNGSFVGLAVPVPRAPPPSVASSMMAQQRPSPLSGGHALPRFNSTPLRRGPKGHQQTGSDTALAHRHPHLRQQQQQQQQHARVEVSSAAPGSRRRVAGMPASAGRSPWTRSPSVSRQGSGISFHRQMQQQQPQRLMRGGAVRTPSLSSAGRGSRYTSQLPPIGSDHHRSTSTAAPPYSPHNQEQQQHGDEGIAAAGGDAARMGPSEQVAGGAVSNLRSKMVAAGLAPRGRGGGGGGGGGGRQWNVPTGVSFRPQNIRRNNPSLFGMHRQALP